MEGLYCSCDKLYYLVEALHQTFEYQQDWENVLLFQTAPDVNIAKYIHHIHHCIKFTTAFEISITKILILTFLPKNIYFISSILDMQNMEIFLIFLQWRSIVTLRHPEHQSTKAKYLTRPLIMWYIHNAKFTIIGREKFSDPIPLHKCFHY